MENIAIFRINYKSDFILTLKSDAGWMTPFCIKFWTGAPSQAYFVGFDGTTYTHCAPVDGDPTKLRVQFDDHHLPIGDLKFQIGYHFTVADFPNDTEDEVLNQASVIIEQDGEPTQVMLDFNGETAPEIEFSLPAYANEAQRIANEEQRIAAEQLRIANEDARIQAEETRQYNEQQRIQHEEYRVSEFARLKSESEAATTAADTAATLANEKAQLAAEKAALAQAAATLANEKAQLAADKAALAAVAATIANDKAALAQQKAAYAQEQGDYAKAQGDYAKAQGDTAQADHERAETDHTTADADHSRAEGDHTTAASDHSRAEGDHTTAASDHTRAESDHTTAASDHSRAEADHTTAASDHTRAESDHTTAASDHETAASDHTRAESDHASVEVYVDSLGAFDISAYHATGDVLAKYADLTAALGTEGANIPEAIHKGGMSIKFVQSSDNKYLQYRLMSDTFNVIVANWQGVDDVPTPGSKNFVESGGVVNSMNTLKGTCVGLGEIINETEDIAPVDSPYRKNIKVLFIGNSICEDHVTHLPWLFKNTYGDDFDFTLGIVYRAGITIKEYVEKVITGEWNIERFSVAHNSEKWIIYNNTTLDGAIGYTNWDIVVIEPYFNSGTEDISYAAAFIEHIKDVATNAIDIGVIAHQVYYTTYPTIYTWLKQGITNILSNYPISVFFPCGLATKYMLDAGFSQDKLTTDNIHNIEGLPCIIGAYVIHSVLSEYYSFANKVIGNKNIMSTSVHDTLNIPGQNGTLDATIGADDYYLGQQCAIKAFRCGKGWFSSANNSLYTNL